MTDQVAVAVLSGGFALLVALLGIGGAIAAQVVATRRAFANSLALFERQTAEAQQARDEAARTADRHRFTDQKKSTYSRTLRLADELVETRDAERTADKNLERSTRTLVRVSEQSESLVQAVKDYETAGVEYRHRVRRLTVELAETIGEIHLLSDNEVRVAAERLHELARAATHVEAPTYVEARDGFLSAARRELGVDA
jgi:hypothetical protein